MNIPENIWDHIYSRIQPVIKPSMKSKSMQIRFKMNNGGIEAIIPPHTVDEDIQSDNIQSDDEYTVNIFSDIGYELQSEIYKYVEDNLISTPTNSSINYYYFVLTENELQMTLLLTVPELTNESNVYTDFSEILVNEDVIDSKEDFSHATIDTCYKNSKDLWSDESETWRFDGTVYFYTDEPYNYWSKGSDDAFPENIDEWYEFASNDAVSKKLLQTQSERFRIHTHPTKWRIKEMHPYVKWYNKCESMATDKINVDNFETNLRSIELDKSITNYTISSSQTVEY